MGQKVQVKVKGNLASEHPKRIRFITFHSFLKSEHPLNSCWKIKSRLKRPRRPKARENQTRNSESTPGLKTSCGISLYSFLLIISSINNRFKADKVTTSVSEKINRFSNLWEDTEISVSGLTISWTNLQASRKKDHRSLSTADSVKGRMTKEFKARLINLREAIDFDVRKTGLKDLQKNGVSIDTIFRYKETK